MEARIMQPNIEQSIADISFKLDMIMPALDKLDALRENYVRMREHIKAVNGAIREIVERVGAFEEIRIALGHLDEVDKYLKWGDGTFKEIRLKQANLGRDMKQARLGIASQKALEKAQAKKKRGVWKIILAAMAAAGASALIGWIA